MMWLVVIHPCGSGLNGWCLSSIEQLGKGHKMQAPYLVDARDDIIATTWSVVGEAPLSYH